MAKRLALHVNDASFGGFRLDLEYSAAQRQYHPPSYLLKVIYGKSAASVSSAPVLWRLGVRLVKIGPAQVRLFLSGLLPAMLLTALGAYVVMVQQQGLSPGNLVLPGQPLATYEELYPIEADVNGGLVLNPRRFQAAVDYFSATPSPRAIADLLYLGNSNNVTLLLDTATRAKYANLGNSLNNTELQEAQAQRTRLLGPYVDIVNGIGQTFAGTPIEIVLHDTRNPLHSIVAVQNPISGRRMGDTNTNFGLQLIKNYSTHTDGPDHGSAFVSYGLTLKDGRQIKSTTIPLFHETYGLIGFICINVDISKVDLKDPAALARFVENFRSVTENEAITEMIQNSKRRKH